MLLASLASAHVLRIGRCAINSVPPDAAGDPDFQDSRPILGDAAASLREEPGIVLADNDAGHYIRYYTECSVIANNFLLTRQHEEKIRRDRPADVAAREDASRR